jgi:hypothetical protein
MAEHRIGDSDATTGVGLHEWGGEPLRRARLERAAGGVLMMIAIVGIVLCFIATTFGVGPLALPLLLLLLPIAYLGGRLRAHGSNKLRKINAARARAGGSADSQ